MRRLWCMFAAVVLLTTFLAGPASAVPPAREFSYIKQTNLPPGSYKFVFNLYDSTATDAIPVWSSGTVALTLKTPLLLYRLGSGKVKILDTVDFSQQLYLEVAKTSPAPTVLVAKRERLPIAPYAMQSLRSDINTVAAFAGGEQSIDLTSTPTVVRSVSLMPPADGIVIVNSGAHLTRFGAGATGARCSISSGTAIDYAFLQIADMATNSFTVLSGTRGFQVTAGVLFTANLVCDEYTGDARLQDSSLTAVFAPM